MVRKNNELDDNTMILMECMDKMKKEYILKMDERRRMKELDERRARMPAEAWLVIIACVTLICVVLLFLLMFRCGIADDREDFTCNKMSRFGKPQH